ncbi:MAG: D-alanyl-lipoteichoic acid biosynthesis protein DltB [Eggerthellales bacterium]|nr:D-alanyl-lipoteichoic acid biosynthesis protein DltB [Eggerthellales bacterium]
MSFYIDPAFFIIVGVAMVPAVLLGLQGRASKTYGLGLSLVMLGFLFCRDLGGLAAFAVFLAVSCGAAFATLHWFTAEDPRRILKYRLALVVALLPLVSAKVSAVFDANILGFLGISYLTFKSVQVIIEIRDGLITQMSFADYLYFLVFFPVFTSGPIMRSRDFMAQIAEPPDHDEYVGLLAKGLGWFVKGVVYSFLLAGIFHWLLWFGPSAIGTATTSDAVLAALVQGLCYGLYLFFDFAGYSLMAMGVGAAMGVRVPANFNAPFASLDIKDFWNRWHITLSFWLRDYVFMRVSRVAVKRKWFKDRAYTACLGFMCNMTLMGLWHGLTVDYIAYGIYHGLLLSICELYQRKSKFYKAHKKETWYKVLSWFITMVAVFFGFALFSGQVTTLVLGAMNV